MIKLKFKRFSGNLLPPKIQIIFLICKRIIPALLIAIKYEREYVCEYE